MLDEGSLLEAVPAGGGVSRSRLARNTADVRSLEACGICIGKPKAIQFTANQPNLRMEFMPSRIVLMAGAEMPNRLSLSLMIALDWTPAYLVGMDDSC